MPLLLISMSYKIFHKYFVLKLNVSLNIRVFKVFRSKQINRKNVSFVRESRP